ncbi:hypothetical protein [Thiocapsa marina]|uniref:hypothetical protein n=1 Tax=Thiocapsa marina TaxID=244573 RepID=UPI001112BC82|nr:hypothetical protein [Thiocapsa marina]
MLHLDPALGARVPLACSTWSDALCSAARLGVLRETLPALVADAVAVLPDRLADIPGLGTRPARAIDGTYQARARIFAAVHPSRVERATPRAIPC